MLGHDALKCVYVCVSRSFEHFQVRCFSCNDVSDDDQGLGSNSAKIKRYAYNV